MSKEQHNNSTEVTLEGDAALDLWLKGKDAWNEWIDKHSISDISFKGVRFSYKSLEGKLSNNRVVNKDSELDIIDFSGFKFHNVTFSGAHFHGKVDFSSAQFLGSADFSKARFSVAIFSNSTFKDLANFTKASFFEKAEFSNVNFNSHVHCEGVLFQGSLSFDHSKVCGNAIFIGSKINGDCTLLSTTFHLLFAFNGVKVDGIAVFSLATFGGSAMFNNATFNNASYFSGATFKELAYYSASIFQGDVEFNDCNFYGKSLNFKKCQFHETIDFQPKEAANLNHISFEGASFSKQLTISGHYNCIPDLRQTKTSHHIDLSLLTIKLNRHFLKNTGMEAAVNQEDADRLCRLKEIAESNKNHERALAFYADELRAKRWHTFNPWQSILDGLYSLTSNYGQSIMRPCMYLLASVFIFASATLSQTKQSSYDITQMKAALTISVATATPFLAISKEARTKSTEELFNKELPDNYYLYSYIHSGSSFVFMFLIGLGLRNRFRI
ncbi:pentapeptide repeat-containing protein [Pseudoalteromonas piscicida]|uniref:pentapeptide repeat-containing protein n=1 Tax=Pseudoalteromonas piscicida TaxID=43662 RepID=UPI001C94EDE7|nr:pentapeptide repeat-containing protein [Pseudoalteromonas piscicida]QZO12233.1 pentapeptide repeat-containing protein [Pseudoalteromonas piscicida]